MSVWQRKRPSWDWQSFLTEEERAVIDDALRSRAAAKQRMAEAGAIIGPIQNRAIHRAKYAATTRPTASRSEGD